MEIKIGCACGQKYSFDVEPVGGRMPIKVACPICGLDGTESANAFLAQQLPNQAPAIPMAALAVPPPIASGKPAVRISQSPALAVPGPITPMAAAAPKAMGRKAKASGEYSLGLGTVGAVLGAALGAGLVYGFFFFVHIRFPFMGTCVGALTGLGARMLARGTDATLGGIAGAIALAATGSTLYLMYGGFAVTYIITMVVSVAFAWRIAG